MAIEIRMPALSPTMEEGTLAKWLVKEGDHIGPGDIMAEIETDKATMEFEAVEEGTLAKIAVAEGTENVKVGTIIAMLAEEGEDAGDVALPGEDAAPEPAPSPAPEPAPSPAPAEGPAASPTARKLAEANGIDLAQIEGTGPKGKITKSDVEAAMGGGGAASVTGANSPEPPPEPAQATAPAPSKERIIASPLARRMAEQQGIDLAQVEGTGPNGRIVKADIESFDASAGDRVAAQADTSGETAKPQAASAPAPAEAEGGAPFEEEKLSNVRKVIARRLTESKQTVPHYYLTIDIRLDPLLDLRKQLNASLEPDGIKLSVNDLLIKALARALMRVPQCNVSYHGETIRRYSRADISVAVAAPSGLITPVITNADTKGLAQISREMKELAGKAREGRLKPHEYQGGTASLSNLGMYGIKQFDAVINPPQGMILAVGSGQQQPHVVDGEVRPATVMHASGSFDHRAIDGADGAQLMEAIKSLVENPMGLVV
ncbi:2-oxo acid dehydrogenase subunit E2 [Erythrobacter sp. HL-111]|uniref:2-oxo acid dehydrogenase subunit E2 n=1 Tax=Erythrobacter sp. HL-111 TaxID=1798193 RepID=UPI0006DA82BA|nr:2-oxo acid dehydrogenase subunit E2 [Erythrobacter sp. HL-111]KPP88761.1 MAG: pyruvate dehydrogenase E2 dihydrolipoamide acetyltransferase component PdhC [Erythrobacteraceae bacterium HL-111]SDR95525.1 pyruvate dehydrogenase E2 component (dihydrolipoamide acetyltransferase) [Erythrobacter sp. HL-111]